MTLSRFLCAASVAIPAVLSSGATMAQQIVNVPPGMAVVVVPGPGGTLSIETYPANQVAVSKVAGVGVPVMRDSDVSRPWETIAAEQGAIMNRMMADMDTLFAPMSDPFRGIDGMIERVMSGAMAGHPSGNVMVCEEKISVDYQANGMKPLVKVSRTGNGCGPMEPTPADVSPPSQPSAHPGLIEVNGPDIAPRPNTRHRT
jgi:hypothetical protein